ncbi:MAG: MaoC family dehydratase N-terminal domain-containing protein [Caldilineaceae bacterium]
MIPTVANMPSITDNLESWLGRSTNSEATLDVSQANRMAVTLDHNPTFQTGEPLPPAWHWLYFHDFIKASDLGQDGHPKLGLILPPVPLPKRMWAGGSFVFHAPLRLGDKIQRTSVVRSITAKEGRSGLLYFVVIEHTLATSGVLNLVEEQTIVYRDLASETQVSKAQPAPTDADYRQEYTLNSTALFRYSALTFNGHRIHYDVDYCRTVEGYPNLVIHGPLVATLLLDLYVQQQRSLHWFRYRAKSPLFLPHSFMVNGKSAGENTQLWASNHEGGLAMEAEAG